MLASSSVAETVAGSRRFSLFVSLEAAFRFKDSNRLKALSKASGLGCMYLWEIVTVECPAMRIISKASAPDSPRRVRSTLHGSHRCSANTNPGLERADSINPPYEFRTLGMRRVLQGLRIRKCILCRSLGGRCSGVSFCDLPRRCRGIGAC